MAIFRPLRGQIFLDIGIKMYGPMWGRIFFYVTSYKYFISLGYFEMPFVRGV